MAHQKPNLTAQQAVRLDATLALLESGRARSTLDAMMQADAIEKFVMTGEIVGHLPPDEVDDGMPVVVTAFSVN